MATTLNPVQWLLAGVTTTAGVAVASGKVRFYDVGTLVAQTVYSDNAGSSAISQPLTLSAGGTGTAYTVSSCRIIVKDSTDTTTLWDVTVNSARDDQIYVTSPAFNGGTQTLLSTVLDAVDDSFGGSAGYWKVLAGTSERNLSDSFKGRSVSVKDYGALGDDATDDVAAIQAALNGLSTTGGTLILDPGTYRISSALTGVTGVAIRGAGKERSIIKTTSTTANVFTVSTGYFSAADFSIKTSTVSSGAAFEFTGATGGGHDLSNIRVTGMRKTIYESAGTAVTRSTFRHIYATGDDTANTIFFDGVFENCVIGPAYLLAPTTNGITAIQMSGAGGGQTRISDVRMDSNGGTFTGIRITATQGKYVIDGCTGDDTLMTVGLVIPNQTAVIVTNNSPRLGVVAITDARTGSPIVKSLNGTVSTTPTPYSTPITKIIQAGAAATTTINAPTGTYQWGFRHTVVCSNTSGGALTWTWNAAFHISAAVAPATGNRMSVEFYYDPVDAAWYELYRSAAVPN